MMTPPLRLRLLLLRQRQHTTIHTRLLSTSTRLNRVLRDPWNITEDEFSLNKQFEDLPLWDKNKISNTTQTRLNNLDTIPTLTSLSQMKFPSDDVRVPLDPLYSKNRKITETKRIQQRISQLLGLTSSLSAKLLGYDTNLAVDEGAVQLLDELINGSKIEKQEITDKLFTLVRNRMTSAEGTRLGDVEKFKKLVDRGLTSVLLNISSKPSTEEDDVTPAFINAYPAQLAPKLLQEQWDLSADVTANKIMLRHSMTKLAAHLTNLASPSIVRIHGEAGVGKSVTSYTITLAARAEGWIVLWFPSAKLFKSEGKFVEYNGHDFDCPYLAKLVLDQLMTSHSRELELIPYDSTNLAQLIKSSSPDNINDIYQKVMTSLKSQTDFKLLICWDDYTNLAAEGVSGYYHGEYKKAEVPLPLDLISSIRPLLPVEMMTSGAYLLVEDEDVSDEAKFVVGRYTNAEVEHMLSHYEEVGFGRLRVSGGDDVIHNLAEIGMIKMRSANKADELMKVCVALDY